MDRRTFLASTMTTGTLAAASSISSRAAIAFERGGSGLTKQTIPTPALVLDLDAFEANLKTIADHCKSASCTYRPHAKTHKCPAIARRQIEAGAAGTCVATVSEAEAMAAAGIGGILLTSPIVDDGKIARMIELVKRGGSAMLALGHEREAELLAVAAEAAKVSVDVLIDVDVGDRRTGILPGQPAVELARKVATLPRLRVVGVQAYAGHASHTVGFENRSRVSREAMGKAAETKRMLQKAGLQANILSGGSTGTYNIDSAIDGVTELQVGSYVFMDVDYRRIGGRDGGEVYRDFEPSLTVLATVVSATHADRVSVDAGTKAIDTTTSHRPPVKDWPKLSYSRFGDEFGAVTAEDGGKLPTLGERLEFYVPHCDPNVNLYDRIYACRGEQVEGIWDIAARREWERVKV
jgi:D-serine deaminase-like pyridoxal phosphate-dependent protein